MNRGRLFRMTILILLSSIMFWGCRSQYCYDSRQIGYKEVLSVSRDYYILTPDSTTNHMWTYAADRIPVYNTDLHSLCVDSNLANRVFTSKNILEIRQCREISNHYIEFIKAKGVDLKIGNFIFAREKRFCFATKSEVGTYYVLVPFKKKRLFKEYSYAYEIPITYISDSLIIVHTKPMNQINTQQIKNHLLPLMDTSSATHWIDRCQQTIKVVEYGKGSWGRYFLH